MQLGSRRGLEYSVLFMFSKCINMQVMIATQPIHNRILPLTLQLGHYKISLHCHVQSPPPHLQFVGKDHCCYSLHYSVEFVSWVGLGISQNLFGIIFCLFLQ